MMEIESCSSYGRFKLYDQLELLEFKDKYVIKSVASPDQGFSIGRRDGNIEPINGKLFIPFSLLLLLLF